MSQINNPGVVRKTVGSLRDEDEDKDDKDDKKEEKKDPFSRHVIS
jgi:hypothetical protein